MENRALRIACLTAVLFAIPGAHLLDMGYPVISLEVMVVTAIFAGSGLLLGLGTARRPRLYYPALGLALAWFASVYWIYDLRIELAVIALSLLAFPWLMKRHETVVLPGALAFFVFWSGSSVLQPTKLILTPPLAAADDTALTGPPPFIHIILDEQMSPTALPDTIPPGHPAGAILEVYRARGFNVHAKAMSSSIDTYASIGALMSLRNDSGNYRRTKVLFSWAVARNAEEQALLDGGYHVVGLQSDFLEFCTPGPKSSCHTHTRSDSLGSLVKPELSASFRIGAAFLALEQNYRAPFNIRSSILYRGLAKWLGTVIPMPYFDYFSRSSVMVDIAAELQGSLARPESGRAFVLHMLVPHFPYILDRECQFKPVREWRVPPRYDNGVDPQEVYLTYWDQSICANRLAMDMITAVENSPLGKRAIIFVHGDHGSRIGRDTPLASNEENLQTFLAVKTPTTSGQLFTEEVNLQLQFAIEFRKALGLK